MRQDPEGLSLEQAFGVLRRRGLWIVLCVVVAGAAAFGFSKHETKKYTATASLSFSTSSLSQQIAGLSVNSGSLASQQASDLELVRLGDMAAKTAELLGHGLTEGNVASSLSVAGQGESSVVDVSAVAASPALAAAIANTYTNQFVKEQQNTNRQYFKSALALVNKQLAGLSRQQKIGGDGVELEDRAQTLGLLAELNYGNVQVAQEALPPTSPSSPKTSRNTALGLFLGLIIGLGLVFVLERLDRRIRKPEDLEAIYRLPMLGVVPESDALARSGRERGNQQTGLSLVDDAEVFSLIRAHLRFFNIDRDLRTIIVASAAPGDGKTTIARHLAEAAARLGSRVLLLEVDLRNPTLNQQLDIQRSPGLADVLIGAVPVNEATQSVELEAPPGEAAHGRTFDVLAAGSPLPPNPAELLESNAMNTTLERAKSYYDLVVIDTPPLTAVSDAFSLLTKVDGVVIVGWVGRSRRDAAEQLHQVLASSGAPLLGVIANGSKSGTPTVYPSPKSDNTPPTPTTTNGASPPSHHLTPTTKA